MNYGIDNIKKLLTFALSLSNELSSDLSDGKISFFEGLSMVTDIMQLTGVVKAWPAIKQEIADLDADERKQLNDFVAGQFGVPNANVEAFVEKALSWVLETVALATQIKTLKKK